VLCCAVLCCAVLCCAVLCCAVLCCAVLCCAAASVEKRVQGAKRIKAGTGGWNSQVEANAATHLLEEAYKVLQNGMPVRNLLRQGLSAVEVDVLRRWVRQRDPLGRVGVCRRGVNRAWWSGDVWGCMCRLQLITAMPVLYVANIGLGDTEESPLVTRLREYVGDSAALTCVCATLEAEASQLPTEADTATFLMEMSMKETGLSKIIRMSSELLGMTTFYTVGPQGGLLVFVLRVLVLCVGHGVARRGCRRDARVGSAPGLDCVAGCGQDPL
jgi:ribosome-binding ATPase YchF (GTP1/OBG family)